MRCEEILALLSSFYDGELAPEEHAAVVAHLKSCEGCSTELEGFRQLSRMAQALDSDVPPANTWVHLEQQLDAVDSQSKSVVSDSSKPRQGRRGIFVLVATLLLAIGIGWGILETWPQHHEHEQFSEEFGHYLSEFQIDPMKAQQFLLAKYEHHDLGPGHESDLIPYRPAISRGVPEGYEHLATRVMKMPCCTCVQTLCSRRDGSILAVFEHDDEETSEWFAGRSGISAECSGKLCCLVDLNDQLAVTWQRGKRHMTLIGVQDISEANEMVAWFGDAAD